MRSPFDQSSYQVRLDWGTEGLARLAPADIVIAVDVLRFSSTLADAVAAGQRVPLEAAVLWSANGAAVAAAASAPRSPDAPRSTVLVGGIRNAAAVARAVMTLQERQGARASVSIVAAGELASTGELRFAVEDQLGAGAIVAALCDLGIDHSSPEAAAAAEAFRALRPGLRHMLIGSGSGRELVEGVASTARMEAAGVRPATTAEAAELDAVDAVPELRLGIFERFV
ncbi:phosphosulfolactate phosphohydrolase [Microbacterium esteraromaticum]|uniref:Probable 2-phosphosulfolactate phosphatase n=1 Tax=Microbacterium esteraromaticum TaxID=57043 RepID=A0A7D7WDR9_9MICO|nr:2-phosphosulfolactate phosphatase [Microbacterium esteraromaticum]QMU97337.1 phosphosulfolactate phosphohydrolase [Microbacterium esteraromaticum]